MSDLEALKWTFLSFWLVSCAATPRLAGVTVARDVSGESVEALRNRLQVPSQLGLQERTFNSCQEKFKDGAKCGVRTLVSIGFRLMCRDSEGTVSVTPRDLLPVINDQVQWKLAGQSGFVRTDGGGFAVLSAVTAGSVAGTRLVLIVGKQFLGIDTSDVGQIVVPIYWCTQN